MCLKPFQKKYTNPILGLQVKVDIVQSDRVKRVGESERTEYFILTEY